MCRPASSIQRQQWVQMSLYRYILPKIQQLRTSYVINLITYRTCTHQHALVCYNTGLPMSLKKFFIIIDRVANVQCNGSLVSQWC
jgi:hypothetical protein